MYYRCIALIVNLIKLSSHSLSLCPFCTPSISFAHPLSPCLPHSLIHSFTCTYAHIMHTHMHTHTCTQTYTHTHAHTHTHTHAHTHTHTRTHARKHARARAHTHTHIVISCRSIKLPGSGYNSCILYSLGI